jgi:hypothetical protein
VGGVYLPPAAQLGCAKIALALLLLEIFCKNHSHRGCLSSAAQLGCAKIALALLLREIFAKISRAGFM